MKNWANNKNDHEIITNYKYIIYNTIILVIKLFIYFFRMFIVTEDSIFIPTCFFRIDLKLTQLYVRNY